MNVLITGSTGHPGAHLVREALADGHTVRALVRPTSNRAGLDGLDVEIVEGDMLQPESLTAAMEGVAWVLHAAAVHRNWAPDEAEILRPAIEGTDNVLRAAATAGVKRVVHTSSNATIGYPRDGTAWDESHHMTDARSPYIRAKCESEALALRLAGELGVELVVVNPSGILGPYDFRLTPTTRSVKDMADGGPAVVDVALTHAADLARGHLLAAEKGRPGERYILAGDNLTKEEIAAMMTELTGVRVRAMSPPRWLMGVLAWNEVRKAKKSGADAGITREILQDAWGSRLHYDSSKAQTELGWFARPSREVVAQTLAWLAHLGHLSEAAAASVAEHCSPDPAWPAR